MFTIKNKRIKWAIYLGALGLGALAGFSYWYWVGCASGTCAITSSPAVSSLYGAGMGYLLANVLIK